MLRRLFLIVLGFAWLPEAAVAAPMPPPTKAEARSDAGRADSATKADYVLQPSDLLKVQVFQEDDLNCEVRVSQECSINLSLIGTVNLTGKTVRQAEDYIRALYERDYLVHPQVHLLVEEYAPRNVFVLGSVAQPGVVLFPREQGLTLLDAISRAGSFNRLADKKHVTLKRTNADGKADTWTINCEDLSKGDSTETWPLQPNDLITVPERIL